MRPPMELLEYPLAIEPTVECLEVLVRIRLAKATGDSTKTYWAVFRRLPPRWNYPIPLDNSTPHLFGNSKHLGRSDIVLGYSPAGLVRAIHRRERGGWSTDILPEKVTGAVNDAPSLRIVFRSNEERQAFVDVLTTLRESPLCGGPTDAKCPNWRGLVEAALRNMRFSNVCTGRGGPKFSAP